VFGKLLIANRGEIACRVARTARRLGVRTVAVFSDADAGSAHVAACDEAVHIGGSRPQDSYLRGDVILEAARRTGAEAIHPGYGFLSENSEFAAACGRAGIVFIGPSPEAIAAMGSKSAAKALMEKAGVPLTPGYHGERQDLDYLLKEAMRIGFPVLIKAVAGGGGKGMRRVDNAAEFASALASCQREAAASFKDERVLVEKYLTSARHIEIQVFGDNHGNTVHLFERDCSVQRRHQKVIEEAPAPGMTPERRRQMGEAAVAAARAVDYRGAGTVEFIATGDAFYFMEMNTRLQVEHPVTEMITGLDLVEWQLRVAAGERLPLKQEQLALNGHAIEARIYAEDPAHDFLPSIGRLVHLSTPQESGTVRVDTGVRQGDEITPFYDPMIAKLIVHADTRAEAVAKMKTSLAQYQIVGVRANVEFLVRLMSAPAFVRGALDTALIERERAHLFAPRAEATPAMWEMAAQALWKSRQVEGSAFSAPGRQSPWEDRNGWALGGRGERRWKFREGEVEREVAVRPGAPESPGVVCGNEVHLFLDGAHRQFQWIDPYLPTADHGEAHGGLRATMPGRVLAVHVKVGDEVPKGAPLVVLEAMKMEQTVTAPSAGKIGRVLCEVGEQVREGAELLTFVEP
jgi:3-methylcrotonyl-CoA carboxylase alpha subunit